MKSWIVKTIGNPNNALELAEMEIPNITDDEVLIGVNAAALNFFDILQCQGKYQEKHKLPFTIGAEIAGVVKAVGKNTPFKIGDRVSAMPELPKGGLSEMVAVNHARVFPIPDSLAFSEAASMMITFHTAYYALHTCGKIKKGEILIVHGGAGGVGSAAIQIGKEIGAIVYATENGDNKATVCKDIGADVAINISSTDFIEFVKKETEGKGADLIFDPVGGDVFDKSRKCISFFGRILAIGFASGKIPEVPLNHILIKNYSVVGVHWGLFAKIYPEKIKKEHQNIMHLYEKKAIKPIIYKEFEFIDLQNALELLSEGKCYGKLVIKVK
ncbi:oxidoreductase [Desulfosarcina widdelii]|uniref:Oxidoreductase n=1 Tax=Desulfosarcina widdelii TaxID=947919 RepID=A0A5K7YYV6_9BACT|nr:NADPH:quinone oxidoreductase family protein [Desulfosarcina widdelii]BBO73103.1 oxidoreductase [Desulfosarcina widdelii]